MNSLKILAAAVAAATVSLAMAQGTPPRPASDPAVGAGQQSTQGTPMGTTGTPSGAGMGTAQGTTAGSTAATTAGSVSSSPASDSTTMAADTHTTKKHHKSRKAAKADRN